MKKAGGSPEAVLDAAFARCGWKGPPQGDETKLTMLRNVQRALQAGLDNPEGMAEMPRGGAPTIRKSPFLGAEMGVDNGPTSFVQPKNARLYDRHGFGLIRRTLRPGGKVAFWSACEEPGFVRSLSRAGFTTEAVPAKAHDRAKRAAHVIYVASLAVRE